MVTVNARIGGCSAAREMRYPAVVMSATPKPTARLPRSTESTIGPEGG